MVGLGVAEQRIVLVVAYRVSRFAAASFVMAKQMGGDEALASGSIVLSTVLSGLSLAAVLFADELVFNGADPSAVIDRCHK